jgi:hypothetical protein
MWVLKTKATVPGGRFEYVYLKYEVQPNGEQSFIVTASFFEASQFTSRLEADAYAKVYLNSGWEATPLADEEAKIR